MIKFIKPDKINYINDPFYQEVILLVWNIHI